MVMKQTQTKLFDFSDVGLDFCAGSKNLFPDRFKKMLALGYNEQTVSSVAVAGNQVTLTYGGTHGYVADRVLKVDSGALASINGGEFWIDSVTATSITMTIDGAPSSIGGGFVTKIASLGWSLDYDNANIHVYKMKHVDNTDRFVRMCFQNNNTHRNAIAISIGKTFNLSLGYIDDSNALQATASVTTPSAASLPRWDFSYSTGSTHNNWNYAQGVSTYGRAVVVGSLHHLVMLNKAANSMNQLNAILPTFTFNSEILQYPIILCNQVGSVTSVAGAAGSVLWSDYAGAAYIGNIKCRFDAASGNNVLAAPFKSKISVLPQNIEDFNTTTCIPIQIFENNSVQFLGYCAGIYFCMYAADSVAPETSKMPEITQDIDNNSLVYIHDGSGVTQKANATFVAVPVEAIDSNG